jgi:hypothetical protein
LPPSLSPLRPASPVTAHPLPRARPYHAPSFASFVHRQLLQRPSSSSVPVLRPTHLPHPRPHSILPTHVWQHLANSLASRLEVCRAVGYESPSQSGSKL